jgi:hypothetical protein
MSVISLEEQRKLREKSGSKAKSPSKPNGNLDKRGQTHIDAEAFHETLRVWVVCAAAAEEPFTIKSRFARAAAQHIAMAASMGFISVQLSADSFGTRWMVTEDGLEFLAEGAQYFDEQTTD